MIAAWMAYALAVGGALLVGAVVVEGGLRSRRCPVRFVWLAAIAATLSATVLVVRPSRAPVDSVARTGPLVDGATPGWSFDMVAGWSESTVVGRLGASLRRLDRPLLLAWLAGSAAVVLLLGGSMARLSRRRARWQRARLAGVPVLVTDGIGPAVVGVVSPEIAVPRWVLSLDAASQALVLEHERQHVRARDPQMRLVALAAVALVPWNAALWWMLLRLRRGIELDCDARVLSGGRAPAAYASLLVELCARGSAAPMTAAALVDGTTDLERRVAAILDARTGSRRWSFARLATGAALVLAVPVVPRPAVTLVAPAAAGPTRAGPASSAPRQPSPFGPSARAVRIDRLDLVPGRPGGREPASTAPARGSAGVAIGGVGARRSTGADDDAAGTAGADARDRVAAGPGGDADGSGRGHAPDGTGTGDVGSRGATAGGGRGARVGAIGLPFRLDSEIIAALVARHHPDVLATPAADPPLIVFAFDTEGRVLHTRALPNAGAGDGVRHTLLELFPDLRGRRLRATGSISGTLAPGSPNRTLRTIYGVFSPD